MTTTLLRACALLALCAPTPALACACCADPGIRIERQDALSEYDIEQLERIRSDGIVEVHSTDCGEDCIEGIAEYGDWHQSTFSIGPKGFELTVASAKDDQPAMLLTAPAPTRYSWLATDPAPGDRSGPGGLYAEATLPLTVSGSGPAWAGGSKAVPAELILIGQSTACMELDMHTHWMLDVKGDGVNFRLYGRFAPPEGD